MSITEEFLSRYIKEFDFYENAARLCSQRCETEIRQNGIRAIVTYRAKRPDRLRDKLEARHREKDYQKADDISEDIVDLAGVRVALYFPGDMEEVEEILKSFLLVETGKVFPSDPATRKYPGRFSGYRARHYRVRLKGEGLSDKEKAYQQARIEIQVASVLMHAWAEVEHDLVYKPLSGTLSEDEYAILDQLNGLVLSGEIALEQLQKITKQRLELQGKSFEDHFELAKYLYDRVVKRKTDDSADGPG